MQGACQRIELVAAGVDVDSVWEQKKLEARKCSQMRQNHNRPLPALFACLIDFLAVE